MNNSKIEQASNEIYRIAIQIANDKVRVRETLRMLVEYGFITGYRLAKND